MRYAVTLRRGPQRQVYDAQYGSWADAVFGVLRKESASDMGADPRPDVPLEITIRATTTDDVKRGFRRRRRARGCDLMEDS